MVSEVVSVTVTRPANTTAYAAGDVIDAATGAGLTFANVVRVPADKGIIVGTVIVDSANQATLPTLELWLFSAPLAAYDNDNIAFTPTDADLLNLVGVVALSNTFVGDATIGVGGNAVHTSGQIVLPFECADASRDLIGVLVVRNAYTPISAEQFTVAISILQD